MSKSACSPPQNIFPEDSLKIKKGLELVSRLHFLKNFLKQFFLVILHKLAKFITRLSLFSKLFSKMCFVFHVWAFHDVTTFEYLKRQVFFLDIKNKLAKTIRIQPATLLKVSLCHGCYSPSYIVLMVPNRTKQQKG